jgi:hypothetical protein
VPSQDPRVRSLAGRVAAYSRVAGGPPRAQSPLAVIPEAEREGYLAEVDPTGSLPLRERQRRAAAAYRRDEAAAALRAYRLSTTPGDGDAA